MQICFVLHITTSDLVVTVNIHSLAAVLFHKLITLALLLHRLGTELLVFFYTFLSYIVLIIFCLFFNFFGIVTIFICCTAISCTGKICT